MASKLPVSSVYPSSRDGHPFSRRFNYKWSSPGLGPLLFLVHFRGTPEAMSPSQASLFADDTMAFQENCSGEQTSPCCDLGKHIGNLSSWAASNNVDLNAAKSADLVVGSKPPPSACLFMSGTAIPRVQRHVHLGITITSDLRWNVHVATVLKKVAPALHLSLTLAYRRQLPPAVIRKFYVAFIRPRMEYCNAVWCGASARSLKSLEKAQLKVARAIVHSQRWQPEPEVLSACNLPTRRGGESIVCVSCTFCTKSKVHRRYLSFFQQLFSVQARTEIVLRSSHSFQFPFASSSRHLSSFLCFFYPSLEHSSGLCHISESQCFFLQVFSSLFLQSR